MNEIYWITRLDSINTVLCIIVVILCIILAACFISYLLSYIDCEEDLKKQSSTLIRKTIVPLVVSLLLFIFIPTKKDALLIWGVGGTIDYIKSNDTAKQLPDKCIQALDKFVDEYMLNEENNKEK